jgi:prepilin-type processing-associated H-X9-DG protein
MAGGWGKQTFDHDRHQGTINVLFVDGHAESVLMSPGGLKEVGVSRGVYE